MHRITRILLLALGLATFSNAQATAQSPDIIVINGEQYALNTNPLTSQLRETEWQLPKDALISSANWRGYIATWEVSDNRLVLKDVTIRIQNEQDRSKKRSILREIFPGTGAVVATWYSGALIIPDGERTQYVHMGYGSTYSRYKVVRVSSGLVVEMRSFTGEQFSAYKDRKFQEFTGTEEYRKSYAQLKKEGGDMSDQQIQDFMKSFYAETYLPE